jgi:membrane protein DedA with SNARE-associated domain
MTANASGSGAAVRRACLRHFVPLAGFVLPTVLIGYGFVIPRSCIAGWNELTVGFAATVLGACLTYWAGIRLAVRECERDRREA